MAPLLEDQRRLGVRAQLPAPVNSPIGTAQPVGAPTGAALIGRLPPVDMGMVDIVQPPAPSGSTAPQLGARPAGAVAATPAAPGMGEVSNPKFQGGASPEARAWQASRAAPAVEAPALGTNTAAQSSRIVSAARGVGGLVRTAAPSAIGAEVVGRFGDYKLNDPGVDSSAMGTLRALGSGDFAGAGRSLQKGAVEAAMDLGSAGADMLDYVVPGKEPVSSAYNSMLRDQLGDQLVAHPNAPGQPPQAESGTGMFANTPRPSGVFNSANTAPPPAASALAEPNAPLGVTRTGNAFSGANVGSPAGAGPGTLGGTEDTFARLARLQASNASVPQGGLTVIDNPGPAAARAMFDEANLNTLRSRGAPPGRNGAQVFEQVIGAAQSPIQQRAAAAAQSARDAGETQRTLIQERAADARARGQAAQHQETNAINRAKLGLEQQKIGIDAAKANLSANKDTIQQIKDTQDIFSILDQAQPLLQRATNSGAGNAVDKTFEFFGGSTEGAQAGAQLKALQGALISKMPKMSGPQSDKDVQLYREMAGQIGDPTIPREQRVAAMQSIRALNEKYLPAPADAAGYSSLPSGSTFRAPDGSIRRKP